MIRPLRTIIGIWAAIAVSIFIQCGNGSEVLQPNGFIDKSNNYAYIYGIIAIKGVPRSGVMVSAYDTAYIPIWTFSGQAVHTVSDTAGKFSLLLMKGTRYTLLCIDTLSRSGAFIGSVPHDTSLGTITLDSLGSISGKLYGDSVPGRSYLVYLKGTPFYTASDSSGAFTIFGVAPGAYGAMVSENPASKLLFSGGYVPKPMILGSKPISVESGKTTVDSLPIN